MRRQTRNGLCWFARGATLLLAAQAAMGQTVLIEAEAFAERGGWVVDQQFMDQMGSPFLLAHGLGVPVVDAVTRVELPAAGTYRVFVRTRDWVAPWAAPGAPGRFKLLVGGRELDAVFGTEGDEWRWQEGGDVTVTERRVVVALRDLTGFEGRCDAILLTADRSFRPPHGGAALCELRRKLRGLPEEPETAGEFDLVVVGGGMAGTCAAVAGGRLGLKVALIQDRPVLGGNNSSEVRVWLQGARNRPPYPRVGDLVAELEPSRRAHYGPGNTAEIYEDDRRLQLVHDEPNVHLFLDQRANAVEADSGRIRAVIAQHAVTGRRLRFRGGLFADCTGDGCIGFLAGADHEVTASGHMGRSNLWNVVETDEARPFPRCPWALDLSGKPFPGREGDSRGLSALGGWYWESGFDHDPFARGEAIRDWNFRAMYGAWDCLKNVDKRYPNHVIGWAAYISGKRESRRLLGDVVLTKEDLTERKEYRDGCVPTGWKIDLHLADPRYVKGFEGDGFISKAHFTNYPMPYWIPYRCLYSRNVENLFMAGRDISVTHEALGAVRVMRTGGCMGEVVGMAAFLARQYATTPRGVYYDHLTALQDLMRKGVGKVVEIEKLSGVGANAARSASIVTSGDRDPEGTPAANLNDGVADWRLNDLRWLSSPVVPNWVELCWDGARTLSTARVLSGYNNGGGVSDPIESFVLQLPDGDGWRDIAGTDTVGNKRTDWRSTFAPVTTKRVRLFVRKTKLDISRIWEVELYEPATP